MNFSPKDTCVWNLPMSEPNNARSLAFTDKQGYPVGQVGFQFQRERTAVNEAVLIQQSRAVRQQLFASVACFIPGEC